MSDRRNFQIVRRFAAGEAVPDIARAHGISADHVYKICRQRGVKRPNPSKGKPRKAVDPRAGKAVVGDPDKASTPLRRTALSLLKLGMTYAETAEATGLTVNQVKSAAYVSRRQKEAAQASESSRR